MNKRQHARSILSEETLDNKCAIRSISTKTYCRKSVCHTFVWNHSNLRFETTPTGRLYYVFV